MNKTQKGALVGLIILLLALASLFSGAVIVPSSSARIFFLALSIIFFVFAIFFLLRKQSPLEPAFDERDVFIKQKAVIYSFIAMWLILIATCILAMFAFGANGDVTVRIFPLGLLVIFGIVGVVYFTAILIQYGWRDKNE